MAQARRSFRFIKELAEGGFGKVYLAEMNTGDNFSSVVAIKILHGKWQDHDEIVMRSRDEARLLGRLRHRNIVRVEDLTSINGQCAVIMEYLEGVDLKEVSSFLAQKGEDFPIRAALEITAQIASALEAAYNHIPLQGGEPLRLIHRDIKPSNAMITAGGDVKLLDFGTARANFDTREAKTRALAFGSQAYMAPERIMGDPDTPAADIFSLGVSLYELLSGGAYGKIHMRPERYEETLDQRLADLDLGDALAAELMDEAYAVLRLMLAYEPEDRPQAGVVVELMEALAEACTDMGLRRFCRANVRDAMDADPHEGPADDPFTGTVVFEDASQPFDAMGAPQTTGEVADAPADGSTFFTEMERAHSSGDSDAGAPPPEHEDELEGSEDHAPARDSGEPAGQELAEAAPDGPPPEAPEPSVPETWAPEAEEAAEDPDEEEPVSFSYADYAAKLSESGSTEASDAEDDRGPAPDEDSDEHDAGYDAAGDDDEEDPDTAEVDPPDPVALPTVDTQLVDTGVASGPVASPVEDDEPAGYTPPVAAPPPPTPAPPSTGGGKGKLIALALVGLIAVGGGIGFAITQSNKPDTDPPPAVATAPAPEPEPEPPAPEPVVEEVVEEVEEVEDTAVAEEVEEVEEVEEASSGTELARPDGVGSAKVNVVPIGGAEFMITNTYGTTKTWDGKGFAWSLNGIPGGEYWVKITREGSEIWKKMVVEKDKTCQFKYTVDSKSWDALGCG